MQNRYHTENAFGSESNFVTLRKFMSKIFWLVITVLIMAGDLQAAPAPKPLYRDPIYDGAADPVIIWNPHAKRWWMFYTNRRANVTNEPGVAWVHGTRLGIAESTNGANWNMVAPTSPIGRRKFSPHQMADITCF
jgi:hypothetical protein